MYKVDKNRIYKYIAEDLSLDIKPVADTIGLFMNDATVPFIARYRKEVTGGLDEVQVREIEKGMKYYSELEKRKEYIVESISSQGKLEKDLEKSIVECREKNKIEDLYLPYKPKKRTKATVAREKGLQGLADILMVQDDSLQKKEAILKEFINEDKGVSNAEEALSGAVDIVVEMISENAEVREWLRKFVAEEGVIITEAKKDWKDKKTKYDMYYSFREYIKKSVSHRLLAIRRGAKEGVISWKISTDKDRVIEYISSKYVVNGSFILIDKVYEAIKKAYTRIYASLEFEAFSEKIQEAETEAINVFSKNLKNLLLEPPAGHKVIMGIDPGYRTGCKVIVIDSYGVFKEYAAIFPHPPQEMQKEAAEMILDFIEKYSVELIAIGNGTASRETLEFVNSVLKFKEEKEVKVITVSESGASVYSASEVAIREFPDLDVTVRGAISIARRLQDPLSELVKIDPKSIGVGQYQHDVNQVALRQTLKDVVESCVNFVGVEINTASRELLSYVSGVGPALAKRIVEYRENKGPFKARKEIKNVTMLSDKIFEQCAGFLRIRESSNRLDNSSIHPESYCIVEKMAQDLSNSIDKIIGNESVISKISIDEYVSDNVGLPTLKDIIKELKKPGLDPRKSFSDIEFSMAVQTLEDLKPDMRLLGKVTNVTNFGAFVDIGVHQDGLIHISNLSKKFVRDPHEVVSVGDKVRVKVLAVDTSLGRIELERV